MIATYLSSTSISVENDKTADFLPGVRTRVNCGVDGYKYGSVVSRTYNGTITTVVVDGDALTANVAEVTHGFSEPNTVAEHASTHATGGRDAITPASIGALPTAGGTMTGRLALLSSSEGLSARGSISGAQTLDLALGNCFTATATAATTFTPSNVPASGVLAGFVLLLTNGGAYTITWPTGTKWAGGTAPTLTTSGTDALVFVTTDGGTTWKAFVSGKDLK